MTIGGRAQVAGADVILAHRLLKNGVPRHGDYTILTRAALEYMRVDPEHLGLVPHSETSTPMAAGTRMVKSSP